VCCRTRSAAENDVPGSSRNGISPYRRVEVVDGGAPMPHKPSRFANVSRHTCGMPTGSVGPGCHPGPDGGP